MPTPRSTRAAALLRSALLFAFGLAACWRFDPLGAPIVFDNQIYFFIAERAASGVPPHVSDFDPKNALSMLMTAVAIAIGRLFDAEDLMSARALSIGVTAAAFPLLWTVVRRLGGGTWTARVAVAIPLLFHDYLSIAVAGARPKVFLVFFELLWLLAAATGRHFALGLATGCCFLVWQPALLLLVAAAAVTLLDREGRARATASMFAGLLVAVAAYEAYFALHGVLGEQLYQSLVFPAEFGKDRRPLAEVALRLFALDEGLRLRTLSLLLFAGSLAAFWPLLLVAGRRILDPLFAVPGRVALLLGAHGTLAFCLFDYQGFPDRLFLLPFLAIVDAFALAGAVDALLARHHALPLPAKAAGALLTSAAAAILYLQLPERGGTSRDMLLIQREAAAFVGELLRQGDTVYAMGPLHLLAMNRADNFHRYGFYPVRVRAHLLARTRAEGNLMPLRDGKLPDVLLQSRMEFAPNKRWIEPYYRPVQVPVLAKEKVKMWRLVEGAQPPPDAPRM